MKVFIIDAFTNQPFKGNPAGVCLLDKEIDASLMQCVATELNLSETAFLLVSEKEATEYAIRYFTPTVEVDFCGHATLAAAKLVLHYLQKDSVNFTTAKNLKLSATSDGEEIKMLFPLYNCIDYIPTPKLFSAFGISKPLAAKYAGDLEMLIIEVESLQVLLDIKPDYFKALQVPDKIKEVVVTTRSEDEEYDFYSRCFCPWIGINEDPVTGASHAVLAKYWGDILDKTEMKACQASKRGGYMHLKIISEKILEVKSNAQIIFQGTLLVKM